jgi:hypothetical protein
MKFINGTDTVPLGRVTATGGDRSGQDWINNHGPLVFKKTVQPSLFRLTISESSSASNPEATKDDKGSSA